MKPLDTWLTLCKLIIGLDFSQFYLHLFAVSGIWWRPRFFSFLIDVFKLSAFLLSVSFVHMVLGCQKRYSSHSFRVHSFIHRRVAHFSICHLDHFFILRPIEIEIIGSLKMPVIDFQLVNVHFFNSFPRFKFTHLGTNLRFMYKWLACSGFGKFITGGKSGLRLFGKGAKDFLLAHI